MYVKALEDTNSQNMYFLNSLARLTHYRQIQENEYFDLEPEPEPEPESEPETLMMFVERI